MIINPPHRAPGDVATQVTRDLDARRARECVRMAAHAVREDAEMIGWLPFPFYETLHQEGRLVTVTSNGELVGFLAWRRACAWGVAKIIQTWVRRDARMIEHGRALVSRVSACALAEGAAWLSCWVAEDLEAMRFWPAVGFTSIERRVGRGALVDLTGRRMLTRWVRRLMITHHEGADHHAAE